MILLWELLSDLVSITDISRVFYGKDAFFTVNLGFL